MKILFMGTPDFAKTALCSLVERGENVIAVVTQTDKPKGRGMTLVPSPVKEYALSVGIPVYQPKTLRDDDFAALLAELDPELILVAAYGKILPHNVITYPKYGCINAHASLLPKYRGAAPIQRAIMAGETETGVTAMQMDDGLDTGDALLVEKVAIGENDDFETVHDALCEAGARAFARVLDALRDGTLVAEKQGDGATYAEKITKEDCKIDFSEPVENVCNRIRALSPVPLAYTTADGKILKIVSANNAKTEASAEAGTIVSADGDAFYVACGKGTLRVSVVRPEGKGNMRAADMIRGRKLTVGERLGLE